MTKRSDREMLFCYELTTLDDADEHMEIAKKEVFGSVATIIEAESDA